MQLAISRALSQSYASHCGVRLAAQAVEDTDLQVRREQPPFSLIHQRANETLAPSPRSYTISPSAYLDDLGEHMHQGTLGAIAAISTTDIATIVSISLAALAGFTGLGIFLYSRKQRLDTLVNDKVSANIGRRYVELTNIGERIQDLHTELATERTEVQELIQNASEANKQIEEIRNYWQSVLPTKESFERGDELVMIDIQKSIATSDMEQTIRLLHLLLDHSKDSKILERAGDRARLDIFNPALAIRLYERAIEMNPRNWSATAELLALRVNETSETESAIASLKKLAFEHPEEPNALSKLTTSLRLRCQRERGGPAFQDLKDLVTAYPTNPYVLGGMCNAFMDLDDYDGMLSYIDGLLSKPETFDNNPAYRMILLRNMGIAQSSIGKPRSEVTATYEEMSVIAWDRFRGTTDPSNRRESGTLLITSLSPFLNFLISSGDESELNSAEEQLVNLLGIKPTEFFLFYLLGQLQRRRGNLKEAWNLFELAGSLADNDDYRALEEAKREITVLMSLAEAGINVRY